MTALIYILKIDFTESEPLLKGKYQHIQTPEAIRKLDLPELIEFAAELRDELISTVTMVGGHLAPSLGTVELTIALHKVFNTPRDQIVWDVGHQAYAHKMLTGRRERLSTIRQLNGLSGFLKRAESEYDSFGAGHASTSISAAYGLACARDLLGEDYKVVAIIGDGAMTGGLAYEALNNAGSFGRDILVILNDNTMSISPNVGAISNYLSDVITNPRYRKVRDKIWEITGKLPATETMRHIGRRLEDGMKAFVGPGILFEDLGFQYIGPVDGHDLSHLMQILQRAQTMKGPVLLHVLTVKGKGWDKAEADPVKYHGIKAGTPAPSKQLVQPKSPPGYAEPIEPKRKSSESLIPESVEANPAPSFMDAFGEIMIDLAKSDSKIVAITAAMSEGTGLSNFADELPDQFFDVGIAEAHGVCFAAGLAAKGIKPVCAIYSTFLQRAFDQIVHDVAMQHLPVVFCIDRAGLVGEDGPTHHGVLDLSYLSCIQEMIVACPKDGNELRDLMLTAISQKMQPFAIRYPKESSIAYSRDYRGKILPIGSWEVLATGATATVIATGAMVSRSQQAVKKLRSEGFDIGLVNARFVKPVDKTLLNELRITTKRLIVIEENAPTGGLISQVRNAFAEMGDYCLPIEAFCLPDRFVEHGKREELLNMVGLSSIKIEQRLRELLTGTASNTVSNIREQV